jgi:hypothetical protein
VPGRKSLKNPPRNKLAMPSMVKGLMPQLTTSVRRTGLGLRPALTTSPKSIFTMMGYIMKNRQIAMGMETTGAPSTKIDIPSRVFARSGASLPRPMPARMHRPTQSVSWRSKRLMEAVFC